MNQKLRRKHKNNQTWSNVIEYQVVDLAFDMETGEITGTGNIIGHGYLNSRKHQR